MLSERIIEVCHDSSSSFELSRADGFASGEGADMVQCYCGDLSYRQGGILGLRCKKPMVDSGDGCECGCDALGAAKFLDCHSADMSNLLTFGDTSFPRRLFILDISCRSSLFLLLLTISRAG